ncbi:malto-oligosyltrehalose trehalohydrolase [Parenemella sanctibonifatiensis]|uniref:Malto-oligosyltrehalose trehalohydrolase n=1 Tax=Parenemella sanctibonifatiensis TaxID=2016505 RepID=A0A255EHF1_9ACTN|nr:malto-oligosyltrehalose trehalohydrolase [Parenemella sanctibonifatiensis]
MEAVVTNSFDVWAPRVTDLALIAGDVTYAMERDADDWWRPAADLPEEVTTGEVDYGYIVNGDSDTVLPDPRSRWQPDGVHGRSRTFDPEAYQWGDQEWTGRQLAGAVIYELHIGTFTPEGTLDAAIDKLDHLADLGIDLIELMPVNAFNGEAGWGYDGVDWYAVHAPYGGPRAYQRFVDAAHQRGLGVIQDVVYNHFGPSGNYLPVFAPYLNDDVQTGWGAAVNLDGEDSDQVRRYILDNLKMWFVDHHVDGLRLDAVHALVDRTAIHVLEEMAIETEATSAFLGRPLSLIAESDLNDPRLITPREAGGYGLAGQWSDDFHHAVVANLTGDSSGYYADFAQVSALAKVVENGFYHDGTESSFRGRRHGRRIDIPTTPTWRLVVCSDNHDQIGNRADGSRLSSRVSRQQLALAAVVTLLSGCTPMIFEGEEWGASTPFTFFSSHPEPDLAEAVSKGRLEEFAKMDWDPATVPDPQDRETFLSSKLDWDEVDQQPHRDLLDLYRRLIDLRRSHPDFTDPRFDSVSARHEAGQSWLMIDRGEEMAVALNFGAEPTQVPLEDEHELVLEVGEVGLAANPEVTHEAEETDQPEQPPAYTLTLGGHGAAVLKLVRDQD